MAFLNKDFSCDIFSKVEAGKQAGRDERVSFGVCCRCVGRQSKLGVETRRHFSYLAFSSRGYFDLSNDQS